MTTPTPAEAAFEAWFKAHQYDAIPWTRPEDDRLALIRWAFLAAWTAASRRERARLTRYIWHDKDCDAGHAQPYPIGPYDNPCTCGLADALREAGG